MNTGEENNMQICGSCVLPATFPGISFDGQGVCNFCRDFAGKDRDLKEEKKRYESKFLRLLEDLRDRRARSDYDVLMAYSGGKDSTYSMYLLKVKYDLRILALSFDNGFISEAAHRNIRNVTDRLGIDQLFFKPRWDLLKRIFVHATEHEMFSAKSLERASTICTACIGLVKAISVKQAVEREIPMVGFGWSPGQAPLQSAIMKNNPMLVRMNQKAIREPLKAAAGKGIEAYFLAEGQFALPADRFPYNVHPMAWEFYEEKAIVEVIKELGWVPPEDTDSNSSNCLLNAYANDIHIRKYGFHPYVWEITNMVREGVMTREDGYRKIYLEQRKELIGHPKRILGT